MTVATDPSGLKCIVYKWKPHIDGSANDADVPLVDPIHRRALDIDLSIILKYYGIPNKDVPVSWVLGRYGKYPRVNYIGRDGKPTTLIVFCFAIDAYYCGEDCRFSALEEITEVFYGRDLKPREFPPRKEAPYGNHVPGEPVANPEGQPPLLKSSLANPGSYPCTNVVVYQDCASRIMKPAQDEVHYGHIEADLFISDGSLNPAGDFARYSYEFEVGMKIWRGGVKTDNCWFKELASKLLGDSKDCC